MHLWASFFTKLIKDENNIHYHKWTAIANWLIIDKAKIKSKKPTFQTTTIGAFSTKMICFHIPGLDFSEFHGDRHRHCCSSNSTICRQSKHISGQKKQSLWCLFLIKTCFNRFVTIITMYYTDWCFANVRWRIFVLNIRDKMQIFKFLNIKCLFTVSMQDKQVLFPRAFPNDSFALR